MKLLGLLVAGLALVRGDYPLTVLHTNDVHSHYDQANKYGTDCTSKQILDNECYGGLARMKTAIDEQRRAHKNTLLLDAGDQFQGTMFFTYYKGNLTWEAMNLLGYDLMTLGNHEFDLGPENVARVLSQANFPVVSANVDASSVPSLDRVVKPYHLFPEHGVAVVGYITYTAPDISNIGKVRVEDPVIAVQRAVDEVKRLGYKRVIAVSHNGYHEDMDLATKVKGLALIVGGHSHSYLAPHVNATKDLKSIGLYPTRVTNKEGKPTYVVQAYCWGRFLGHIDVLFGRDGYLTKIGGAPIELNQNIPMHPETRQTVQAMRRPFDAYANQIIGETLVDLDQANCQFEECSMGSFITDVMLDFRPHADMAFINAGGARAAIPKGKITLGNILTVLPFNNAITEIVLGGARIWNLLESTVSRFNQYNKKPVSSSIQVAGVRFEFSPNRLISVHIKNRKSGRLEPLNLSHNYTILTLDFIAAGGDNIIAPPILDFPILDATDEVVARYIRTHSPVSVVTGNRIINVE